MPTISTMLANGIDLPLLLLWGVAVYVPLMLFQVGVEGAILSRRWRISFRAVAPTVFKANCWSLVAGIPVKVFNAWLYSLLLPLELAGYFTRYPYAVAAGTLVYFLVTWFVEARYSLKWLKREGHDLLRARVWSAVLLANLATYAVLGPVHYFATRPIHNLRNFTADTRWASRPPTQVIYVDAESGHLKSVFSDGSNPCTIVPLPVVDYQVSADLNLCLFRGPDGFLHLYRRDTGSAQLIWETSERFFMENVAFSPTGRFVAWFKESTQLLEVANLQSSNRWSADLASDLLNARVVWSREDSQFMVSTREKQALMQVTQESGLRELQVQADALPAPLSVYGRIGGSHWYGGGQWGQSYDSEVFSDLKAWTLRGLGAYFRLYGTNDHSSDIQIKLAVNPGLLHFSHYGFTFTHPAFLSEGRECLFESPTDLYLLDIEHQRIGRVAEGHSFILLTPRYAKKLE